MAALSASPPFTVGGWAWVYNAASTIRQGAKKDTDATVLKTNLSLNWNGPFKILTVGPAPASDTPDNRPRNHLQPCVLCGVWYGVGCKMCSVGCCELRAVSCVLLYISGVSIPL